MIHISIADFVKQTIQANPDVDAASLTAACQEMLKLRHDGATCVVCGNAPIWAAGSALTGTPMCFTCMTGEADDSEDYEVDEMTTI